MRRQLNEILDIKYPVIVAPMFLISNTKMVISALENGATAAFPALNYRTESELRNAIREIKSKSDKAFGINLIVNKSNPVYKNQLNILLEEKISFIITSLGSPEETIKKCKPHGIKVFCDATDVKYAKKVEGLGADAVIAVNNLAGGHCGFQTKESLVQEIIENTSIPVISAGGIGTAKQYEETMKLGVSGVSIGTIFLASEEAKISEEYRQALIEYKAKDIVLSTKLSGSHLTVINTPYVQKVGTKAGFFESVLLKNKFLKKYVKMFINFKGQKRLKESSQKASYKTVWCAGPSIEYIHKIRPLKEILLEIVS